GATSLLARLTWLPASDVRRLTPVAAAAGIAAAFNAPIAAVTFTIEEIVGTLDHTVLSGVVVAAALAAVVARGVLGVRPVIAVDQQYGFDHPSSLILYALLGVVAAVASVAFTEGLLGLRAWFRTVRRIPAWAHPAVGGLATGVLIAGTMRLLGTTGVNGGGYETLSRALAGQLSLKVLLALFVVKIVATIASYSSGGAGGIFAPALFFGAMLGGAVGYLDVALFHHEHTQLGAFALVGMGAVFAGVIRAPITSVLIIFEMTGSYGLVLPLMLANMTSYALARHWRPAQIYEALLAQDGVILPHQGERPNAVERQAATRKDGPTSSVRAHREVSGHMLVTASVLMSEAVIIDASTSIDWIVDERSRRPEASFVVRDDGDGPFRVVSSELLEEILRDDALPALLVASEIATMAPTTPPEASLDGVAALLLREGASDAIVIDAASGEPIGVVRRVAVALAMMEAHGAARPSLA
ncbi:MAG: chloride channel protein, partial [Polyangiales bacterium]